MMFPIITAEKIKIYKVLTHTFMDLKKVHNRSTGRRAAGGSNSDFL